MKKSLLIFLRYLVFVLLTAVWAGIFFNLSEFADSPVTGIKDRFVIFMQWSTIVFVSFILLYLFALNKYIFMIFFIPYTLIGALIAYFRYAYKATLTPMLIDAAYITMQALQET
jgi:glucan phosphoethanolaminetransferase (alkaline phosphatase superfamily)